MKDSSSVIALALQEVGYKEKRTNANLDSKEANAGSNNYNKYAAYIDTFFPTFYNGKKNGFDWCDIFVDYLFIKSFGEKSALYMLCQPEKSCGAGCEFSARYYQQAKRFFNTPKQGDQVFFQTRGTINHTGIVVSVDMDAKVFCTVEGNVANQVSMVKYPIDYLGVYGFGRPRYEEPATVDYKAVALDVVYGKYGCGAERKKLLSEAGYNYEEVQKYVNEIMKTINS